MKTKQIFATVLTVALLTLPGLAWANDLIVTMRGMGVINRDATYDVLSVDNLSGYANYALGYEVIEGLSVYGEYQFGTENDPLFDMTRFDFTIHGALLAVEYAYPLWSFFRPHARAGMGFLWGDLDIVKLGREYDETAFGLRFFATGGFDILFELGDPDAEDRGFFDHWTIGVTADAGWSFGPWFDFDELVPEDSPDSTPAIDLGEATLGGFTWGAGLTLRYAL